MKRFFASLSLLLLPFTLFGCMVPELKPIEHNAIDIPEGKNSKKIALRRVVTAINRGAEIGRFGGGIGCIKMGSYTWKSGQRSLNDQDLNAVFAEELKRYNYRVVGDPSDLFEDSKSGAEIAVGGRITDIKYDACFVFAANNDFRQGSANAVLTVEWQVFDLLDKKVVFRKTVSGNATTTFKNGDSSDAFYNAFANAVQGLLADQGFLNVVLDKDANDASPSMGGLTSAPARGSLVSAPPSDGGFIIANSKQPGSIDAAKKSVVVLQVGGGHGSGFLVGNSGYILTNHHVVTDQKKIRVIFSDGSKTEGLVLKSDARQDIALVQITSPPVTGLPFRLEEVPSGIDVYAIGAPADMGLQGSVSKGVVSGYRSDKRGRWLQSDTTVNRGNSGGPLLDAQGRVVGICSFKYKPDENVGLNFFVPIASAFTALGIQGK